MGRKRNIDRNRIIDAAEAVVVNRGAQALTLDMVAAEAGISKGGLTYTFSTKEALLSAMLDRGVARHRQNLKAFGIAHTDAEYPELRSFMELFRVDRNAAEKSVGPILAALTHAPGSLKSTRTYLKWMLSRFSPHTVAGRRARLVFFAAQGMFLLQGLQLLPFTSTTRRALVNDFISFLRAAER